MIEQARYFPYHLPLNYPLPLKGTRLSVREGFIIELYAEGRYGYGDIAPLPSFSRETFAEAEQYLETLCGQPESLNDFKGCQYPASVAFGVESALWSLRQRQWLVQPDISPLLLGSKEQVIQRIQGWEQPWPAEVKIKAGSDTPEQDIGRIHAVLEHLPGSVKLRLDANQRWTLEQAVTVCKTLPPDRIAYIEEPVADSAGLDEFYRQTRIAFALDETVQPPSYEFKPMPGLAALILKPTLVGGIARCQQLIDRAGRENVRAVFSSSFESSVGIHIIRQLSSLLTPGELPGLDTITAFKYPLVRDYPQPGKTLTCTQ